MNLMTHVISSALIIVIPPLPDEGIHLEAVVTLKKNGEKCIVDVFI